MTKLDITHVEGFDKLPAPALVSLTAGGVISSRSRATLYRDNKAGKLPFVKVGTSTKLKVGDLRRYMGEVH